MLFRKKKFKVEVEGRNFLVLWEETPKKYGFHTVRHVTAADAAQAEARTEALLAAEFKAFVRNAPDDKPMVRMVAVTPVETFETDDVPGQGAEWYLE